METRLKRLRIRQLDQRTQSWQALHPKPPPRGGWLKTIRSGLGMSTTQLASRLKISRQAVADQEQREVDGTITLAALQKAAAAMECDLLYAIVPRRPISEMVQLRAREVAARRLKDVAHSMSLEEQAVPQEEFERQVDDLTDEIIRDLPRDLWAEPAV